MKRIVLLLLASLFFLAGVAQAQTPSNIITDPTPFQWAWNSGGYYTGTLEFGEANITFNNGQNLKTRAYRQAGGAYSIPGPTIKMIPGNKYVLTLKNMLPYQTPSAILNDYKDPNITNIHTHGLHVSPMSPSDDVMRIIEGGWAGDYVYDLSADHMGGTLWYHPHHHGASYLQVGSGAFGLLLVDDLTNKDGIPSGVLNMKDRQLAIGYVDPTVAGTGGDTLVSGSLTPTWTVNGKVQGTLNVPVGEWQHWRVLLADAHGMMKTLSVGAGCEVALLARDGVWRTTAPLLLPNNSIDLTGASRVDLAVRCSTNSTISVAGTIVANVVADPNLTADTSVGPFNNGATGAAWSAVRPRYLRDLRGATQFEQLTVSMGARTINGSKFDPIMPTFTIAADSVQEWLLKGASMHPFHLHTYHVQMNGACGTFEDGEYYDTISASSCLMRFDLNPSTSNVYNGMTMMHCHILDHEDQGAMGWSDIIGGMMPPTFPDSTFKEHYQWVSTGCGTPGAPLLTVSPTKRAITLNWQASNPAPTTGYRIYYQAGPTLKATVPPGTLTYKDSGLTSGVHYCYIVSAWNDCNGNGLVDAGEETLSNAACTTAK